MKAIASFIMLASAWPAFADDWEVSQSSGNSSYVFCQGADCPVRTVKLLDMPYPDTRAPAVATRPHREPLSLTLKFGLASARLSEVNRAMLNKFGKAAGVSVRYVVAGSTDRIGARFFNRSLASKRAHAVAKMLRGMGVPGENIKVESRCCIESPPSVNPGARRVVIRVIEQE